MCAGCLVVGQCEERWRGAAVSKVKCAGCPVVGQCGGRRGGYCQ